METKVEITDGDKLSELVAQMAFDCGVVIDRMDRDITIMKMSETQIDDMAAMIIVLCRQHNEPSFILSQVLHDLSGLKAVFLKHPAGVGFSPRSAGYAAILEAEEINI